MSSAGEAYRVAEYVAGLERQIREQHRVADAEVETTRRMQEVMHDDLAALLLALGLGDHARPESPHEVMQQAVAEAARLREFVRNYEASRTEWIEETANLRVDLRAVRAERDALSDLVASRERSCLQAEDERDAVRAELEAARAARDRAYEEANRMEGRLSHSAFNERYLEQQLAEAEARFVSLPDDAEDAVYRIACALMPSVRHIFDDGTADAIEALITRDVLPLVSSWLSPSPSSEGERCQYTHRVGSACTNEADPRLGYCDEHRTMTFEEILADPYERERLREDIATEIQDGLTESEADDYSAKALKVLDEWAKDSPAAAGDTPAAEVSTTITIDARAANEALERMRPDTPAEPPAWEPKIGETVLHRWYTELPPGEVMEDATDRYIAPDSPHRHKVDWRMWGVDFGGGNYMVVSSRDLRPAGSSETPNETPEKLEVRPEPPSNVGSSETTTGSDSEMSDEKHPAIVELERRLKPITFRELDPPIDVDGCDPNFDAVNAICLLERECRKYGSVMDPRIAQVILGWPVDEEAETTTGATPSEGGG